MQNLDNLLTELAECLESATLAEQKAGIERLAHLHKKLSILVMSELEQNIALGIAETSGNKDELQALAQHSQYSGIRDYALSKLAPRGSMWPRFAV